MQGQVKWFSATKGFGFITTSDSSKDISVHYTAIQSDGYRQLNEGDLVEYETKETPKGLHAENVRVIG
jgi:CspA family cold shock protein